MRTIEKIMNMLGGDEIRVENDGWMPLSIERIGTGPNGLPAISVCHYGEQGGDLMRDPEMCFEVGQDGAWYPYSFQNDYVGLFQQVYFEDNGRKMVRPRLKRELAAFARVWNRNLREQGFIKAAQKMAKAMA